MDISRFKKRHVLVVGDLMIDEYVWGEVERVSPEAPIPVVSVGREDFTLGGAGNVIHNLCKLGASVSAAGVVGGGRYGKLLLEKLSALNVDISGVVRASGRPTTRKTRVIAAGQQVLRIDRETRREISVRSRKALFKILAERVAAADVVLVSDYAKGVVTPSLLTRIVEISKSAGKPVIADPKGLDFSRYAGVSVLTPNLKEAALAMGIEPIDRGTPLEAGAKILAALPIDAVLMTCGKDGMILFRRGRDPYEIKARARQVYDVSGAGDTVLAVFGLALAAGIPIEEAARCANTAAGIVVGKVGTAAVSTEELSDALNLYPGKHLRLKALAARVQELKRQGKKIVLTNGCFDLLHVGHVMLLSSSRQLGDVLVVALDDDDSVRKLKGPERPVIGFRERVRILSALDCVDYVTGFSTNELEAVIDAIRPDILTKGSNYQVEDILGRDIVEQSGGRVVLIPVTEEISTTRIINDIKGGARRSRAGR